jgi:hypothetical protein
MATKPPPKKTSGRPANKSSNKPNQKPRPMQTPLAQQGKSAVAGSYGVQGTPGPTQQGMDAVMAYYNSLPKGERAKAYAAIANANNNRDLSKWAGNPGNVALFQDLSPGAQAAYEAARGWGQGGGVDQEGQPGDIGVGPGAGMPGSAESFSTGVSGLTGAFIKEFGKSKFEAGEAETPGPTADKKKRAKAQRKKLVKRAVKKTDVKGKAIRRAIRSEGVTAKDKKVYKKVAQQSNPKLSARLRMADRRNDKKKK